MRKNKNILKKGMILAAVSTMVVTMAPAIPAYAYGEADSKTGQAAFNAATTGSADYQSWLTGTWQGGTQDFANTNQIALTPGSTANDLGFAWYSKTKGTPAVMVWKDGSKAGAQIVKGTATDISAENWQGEVYAASNKVSINGFFEPDTKYVYQYTDNYSDNGDTVWSAEYTYTTHATDTFSVILTGDPQIGASGSKSDKDANDMSIAQDAYNWNKTMQKAMEIDPDASFLLSAGDQINESNAGSEETKKTRESEYAGFLYPSVLRNLPLASSIGNHESKGTDYKYHYNNPNTEDNLGATNSGSDYYFSYGDVLYIVLNSNNRNAAEHSKLMEKAIKSTPNAKWKVVAFHHDIYGSGQPHSDFDGANLRTIFAPLMDKYDIDVCLTGHDHSYARTYQIIDGTAIEYGQDSATNPEGTLYIAAGSASGSKFYNLATQKQYYIAERSNNQLPTYSTIDFSDQAFTIKTFDYTGAEYAKPFTIKKESQKDSAQQLIKKAEGLSSSVYSEESLKKVDDAVKVLKEIVASTSKDKGAEKLSVLYDKTNNADNAKDPLNYYGYAQGEFASKLGDTTTTTLRAGFSSLLDKTLLPDLTTKIPAATYDTAYANLKKAIDNVEYKVVSSYGDDDLDLDDGEPAAKTTVKKAALTIKKGKKSIAGKTVKLKKGKSFKIITKRTNTKKKVTYKSSNKKYVKVSAAGKVTAKKYTKKTVTITVKAGTLKKTFKVKVTR